MAEHGAGGVAAAGAQPRGGGARVSDDHLLLYMVPNTNRDLPLDGKGPKKITLTKRYRVANENANCANQTLVDYYNAIWETGIAYDRASYTGSKKGDTRSARRVLTKNFTALLDKATEQRVVVVNLGAIPVPFPTNVYKALPQHLKDLMKQNKH